MRFLLVAMLLSLVVAPALAKKQYIKPDDPLTMECFARCDGDKTFCRDTLRDEYRTCKMEYKQLESRYEWCRKRAAGGFCDKPKRCRMARTKPCDEAYDACFVGCGGVIEDSKKKKKD